MTNQQRLLLWLIILIYGILGIFYALATPPLESSDEYKHYPFVQFVQTERRLPVLDAENPGRWLQEAAQPPLYYILMAGLTAPIDTTDLATLHQVNPQAFIGNPGQVGNKNIIIHDPSRESFPWQGSVLAIYTIRAASLLLGMGTILITFYLGQRLFDARIGLFAAALTAFNPMFIFVSAAVNNDSLAILLGSLGLFLLLRLWQDDPDPRRAWWRYVGLGIVLGLGLLTKLSLGGLLLVSGLALFLQAWRKRDWRLLFGGGSLVLIPALLLSGWWFVRNWQLYGDLTGLNVFIAVQGTRDTPLDWAGWISEFGTFYRTYWGLFGGVNVAAPELFYLILNAAALVGIAGLIKWLWSKSARKQFLSSGAWLLLAWTTILLLLLLRWNLISTAFQGRLVFPALGAVNVLWAVGILAWFSKKWQKRAAISVSAILLVAAMLLPWITIRPAYIFPDKLAAVPIAAQIAPVTFTATDGQLKLVGVEMDQGQSVTPDGSAVLLTLYWASQEPVASDYISSVHLLGRELQSVGQIDRYPAMGMIPTSRWQSGDIYRDDYKISVQGPAEAPSQLVAAVSLFDDNVDRTLPATNSAGLPIDPVIVGELVRLADIDSRQPSMDVTVDIPFEQGVVLAGFSGAEGVAGETVPLRLYWRAAAAPDKQYTVFMHLLDQNGERIVGADAPPVGNYYPTSLWQAGDIIDDDHWLPLPADLAAGEYQVVVGLYDPVSGVRLQRIDGAGDSVTIPLSVHQKE